MLPVRREVASDSVTREKSLGTQAPKFGRQLAARAEINGQPGALRYDEAGRLVSLMTLDIADGVVQTIRRVTNPDKLRHLGPLADVRGLLQQRREQR